MAVGGAEVSLLLMASIVVAVGLCKRLLRRRLHLDRRLFAVLMELLSTFQICACTNELCLLGDVEPKPHVGLSLTYGFTVLHGLTLAGSACNPCGTLQPMWSRAVPLKTGSLKIAAQFAAAVLARVSVRCVWSLGLAEAHYGALSQGCSSPMQTTVMQAFCIELLFSAVFQLSLLRAERVNPKYRVHLVALLITMLVYAGGNLTGAIFNPALALSLHPHCFYEKFLNYSLVYWVAPSLGTILVAFIWGEILPRIS